MISTDVMHRPRWKYRHRCFIKRELQVITHKHIISHQCHTHTCLSCHPTLIFLFCYNTIQDTPISHNNKTASIILCKFTSTWLDWPKSLHGHVPQTIPARGLKDSLHSLANDYKIIKKNYWWNIYTFWTPVNVGHVALMWFCWGWMSCYWYSSDRWGEYSNIYVNPPSLVH